MNTCVACGKDFLPTPNSAGKFCSQACYQAQPKKRVPEAERFWSKVQKAPECWLWNGANDGQKGYGRFKYKGQRNISAHRASWIMAFGEISDGLQVLHRCDNPRCVRPDHLFLGTNEENRADCVAKGRQRGTDKNRGSRHGMSKLTESDILAIRAAYIPRKHGNRAEIAARFGVSVSAINQIIWNKRWQHVIS